DGSVGGEQRVEVRVGQPVRVLPIVLEAHQVHHVDHTDLQVRESAQQDLHGGKGFHGGDVAGAGQYDVGFGVAVGRGPLPDADALAAVRHGVLDVEVRQAGLFAGDGHVHVLAGAQAVVGDRQQGVGVRRQVDAHHLGLLVDDVVDESGVLVREPVVVLSPHVG